MGGAISGRAERAHAHPFKDVDDGGGESQLETCDPCATSKRHAQLLLLLEHFLHSSFEPS